MARMLPDGRRLGAHLPLGDRAWSRQPTGQPRSAPTAIQIFGDNPTAWRRRAEPPDDRAGVPRAARRARDRAARVHASYLINLAGAGRRFFERSVALLAAELRTAPGFGARFVNVHIGSHRGTGVERGIDRLADGIAAGPGRRPTTRRGRPRLLLENSAGGGYGARRRPSTSWRPSPRRSPRAGIDRRRGSASASTPPMPGAPAIDLSDPDAIDAFLARVRRADRARSAA